MPADIGLVSRSDGTPMRCYRVGIGPGNSEIIGHQLTAILEDGSRKDLPPTLSRRECKSALSVLGALRPENCLIQDLSYSCTLPLGHL